MANHNSGRAHARFKDLIGSRFGRLEVVMLMPGKLHGGIPWMCRCDCGKFSVVSTANLRGGNTTSCGCVGREKTRARNHKHGMAKTPEFAIWSGIITRCYNPKRPAWPNYGGRGITVCDRWRHGDGTKTGFECFYDDIGPRPSPSHSVERVNNDGNYEPANCRWATVDEQAKNRRRSGPIPKPRLAEQCGP